MYLRVHGTTGTAFYFMMGFADDYVSPNKYSNGGHGVNRRLTFNGEEAY